MKRTLTLYIDLEAHSTTVKTFICTFTLGVPWPNGKALLSGGKDWEFESPWYRELIFFCYSNLRPLAHFLCWESINLIIMMGFFR